MNITRETLKRKLLEASVDARSDENTRLRLLHDKALAELRADHDRALEQQDRAIAANYHAAYEERVRLRAEIGRLRTGQRTLAQALTEAEARNVDLVEQVRRFKEPLSAGRALGELRGEPYFGEKAQSAATPAARGA